MRFTQSSDATTSTAARRARLSECPHRIRIVAAAKHLLQQSRYAAIRRVSCELNGSVLTLRGRVSFYHEKQIAQSLILQRLKDLVMVDNQVEVGPETSAGTSTSRRGFMIVKRPRNYRSIDA